MRRHPREGRGFEQVELVVGEVEGVVAAPFEGVGGARERRDRRDLDRGGRLDAKLVVIAQHVEVIDRVAEIVRIRIKLGARIGGDLERAQHLRPFRARLHAQLHDGLADGVGVAEAGDVADGVVHD